MCSHSTPGRVLGGLEDRTKNRWFKGYERNIDILENFWFKGVGQNISLYLSGLLVELPARQSPPGRHLCWSTKISVSLLTENRKYFVSNKSSLRTVPSFMAQEAGDPSVICTSCHSLWNSWASISSRHQQRALCCSWHSMQCQALGDSQSSADQVLGV